MVYWQRFPGANMFLNGLGDDTAPTDFSSIFTGATLAPSDQAAYSTPVLGPAMSDTSSSGSTPDTSGAAPGAGSGMNFSDIAGAIAKLIPSAVQGAVAYKTATTPALRYAANPVYSGYYGTAAQPGVYAISPSPGALTVGGTSPMLGYIALGLAGIL